MHQLIKNQGDKRVSEAAASELGQELEQYAERVAEEAVAVAEEEGYQTIKDRHLRTVLRD